MIKATSFQYEEVLGIKLGHSFIGKPRMSAYVYYVDGLLIDTAQSRVRNKLLSLVKDLPVKQIFVTHHHEDHTGNAEALRKLKNCPVYGSEMCCEIMKAPPKISLAQYLTWGKRKAIPDLIPVKGSIRTEKFNFQIIPVPGHAPDMVALYEPDKKWLFSSDLYIHYYIGFFINTESITQQIKSLKTVLNLDFKVLFCSHNPQLTHGRDKLLKKLQFLEENYESVADLYQKGYTAKQIFKKLKMKENHFVKILSGGTLSHLNMVKDIIRDIENENKMM